MGSVSGKSPEEYRGEPIVRATCSKATRLNTTKVNIAVSYASAMNVYGMLRRGIRSLEEASRNTQICMDIKD